MIELLNVSKEYFSKGETVHALRGVNLTIAAGEFLAIAGPSGSGKSTMLHLIGGLDLPTSGKIIWQGQDLAQLEVNALSDLRLQKMGFIFQAYNLIPVLTAVENAEYPLLLAQVPAVQARARAMEALRLVELQDFADRLPTQLSGGQQQRVAVARAIVSQPAVILADEPTANLDSKTAVHLLELMQNLNRQTQVTFVFSSHDPQVLSRAQRVVHLHDGEIVQPS